MTTRSDEPSLVDGEQYLRLRRAAYATAGVFAASGAVFGSWASRVPAVRDQVSASPAELGRALLATALGSVLAMPITGRVVSRVGSRWVIVACSALTSASLVSLSLATSVGGVAALLFAFGAGFGAWDVAMNVHGHAVEHRAGRPWMPRYHGAWSLGGMLGAAGGAAAAAADVTVGVHFAVAGLICLLFVVTGLRWWTDDRSVAPATSGTRVGPRLYLKPILIALGVMTVFATMVEGIATDWLALLFVDEHGAHPGVAAGAFTVYATAMAAARFAGTSAIDRWGRAGAVRRAGLLALAGVAVTLLAPAIPLAYVGVAMWGAGVALVFPAAMSAAADAAQYPARAIAAVSTIGYGGFLLAPPLVGYLAEQVGLGNAVWVCAFAAGAIVALAGVVKRAEAGSGREVAAGTHAAGVSRPPVVNEPS